MRSTVTSRHPGTYQSGRPIIQITSFATKLTVISSKQRPRRLSLKGSDGRDYQYVLKGEDHAEYPETVVNRSFQATRISVKTRE